MRGGLRSFDLGYVGGPGEEKGAWDSGALERSGFTWFLLKTDEVPPLICWGRQDISLLFQRVDATASPIHGRASPTGVGDCGQRVTPHVGLVSCSFLCLQVRAPCFSTSVPCADGLDRQRWTSGQVR